MQPIMVRLYDVRDQREYLARLRSSGGARGVGFPAEPDPQIGSDEWSAQIQSGALPVQRLDAMITRAYWGGMADWPEIVVTDGEGNASMWTADGDRRRLVEGLRVRIDYVLDRPDMTSSSTSSPTSLRVRDALVLGVWVQDSSQRIDGIAPGPSGCGYDLARREGEATHYLRVRSRAAADALLAELERDGRAGRVFGGWVADDWDVQVWSSTQAAVRDDIAQLDRLVRSLGGTYDGGEVVNGDVWGPVPPA